METGNPGRRILTDPIWALAPALLSIKFPDSKGKAMGIYNATLHIGLTMGPILGIILLKFWSSDLAFLFYAVAYAENKKTREYAKRVLDQLL